MAHRLLIPVALLLIATVPMLAAAPVAAADSASPEVSPIGTAADNNAEQQAEARSAVPVLFRGTTLFSIDNPLGALGREERAAAIERRLLAIAAGPARQLSELRTVERTGQSELYMGDTLIRVITDRDAQGTGRTRRQLAADELLAVRKALAIEFHDRSITSLVRSAIYALAATAVFAIALLALGRAARWTRLRIMRAAQVWHWESGLAKLRILTPTAVASSARTLVTVLAWLIAIALVYLYLEYVLALFPWTRGLAERMVLASRGAVVRVSSGLLGYLPNVLNIVVIVLVARLIMKLLRKIFEQVANERVHLAGFYPEWAMPTYSLLRFFIVAIAAVMVFPYLPASGSAGFRGVSVFVGLLVSLGAASAIANVIAGIVITYMRPFRLGDRVKIADTVGDVTGKDLFVVRLRTIKNVDVTIPNSLALANHIINFSSSARSHGLILNTTVTIGYDAPWKSVHAALIDAARRVDGILEKPGPFVLQTSLDDFYVSYELNATTDRPQEMARLYSELHQNIQDACNEAGIEIMSPHYASVRDGNRAAMPDQHLPKDYRAPSFNVVSRILGSGGSAHAP